MNLPVINHFVETTYDVLGTEMGVKVQRGKLAMRNSADASLDITYLVKLSGNVTGFVMYGFVQKTALSIVGEMMGEPFDAFDELAQSGITELVSTMQGQTSTRLDQNQMGIQLAEPNPIIGQGRSIAAAPFDRLVVPFQMSFGLMEMEFAISD